MIAITEHIPLSAHTTFKTGGPARFFCVARSMSDVLEAIAFARGKSAPFFILGGGSNVLVSDEGFAGLVIKIEIGGIEFTNTDGEGGVVRASVGAGENWDLFVQNCVERGLYGAENLSFIPGTVGAAPVQNIGAYGAEVKDIIESVEAIDVQAVSVDGSVSPVSIFSNAECGFAYRDSIFKKKENVGRYIITRVNFILKKDGKINIEYKDLREYFSALSSGAQESSTFTPSLAEVRAAVIAIRKKKLPDWHVVGTAGSFFKNPVICLEHYEGLKKQSPELPSYAVAGNPEVVKVPLAWVFDHICGYRGVTRGAIGVYHNQALVIVNNGGGTTAEVKALATEMITAVKEKTGIDIEPEVQYV